MGTGTPNNEGGTKSAFDQVAKPVPTSLLDRCMHECSKHIAHFDLTDDQKLELVRTLIMIADNTIDRAFGIDPVQNVLDKRKLNTGKTDKTPVNSISNHKHEGVR